MSKLGRGVFDNLEIRRLFFLVSFRLQKGIKTDLTFLDLLLDVLETVSYKVNGYYLFNLDEPSTRLSLRSFDLSPFWVIKSTSLLQTY